MKDELIRYMMFYLITKALAMLLSTTPHYLAGGEGKRSIDDWADKVDKFMFSIKP